MCTTHNIISHQLGTWLKIYREIPVYLPTSVGWFPIAREATPKYTCCTHKQTSHHKPCTHFVDYNNQDPYGIIQERPVYNTFGIILVLILPHCGLLPDLHDLQLYSETHHHRPPQEQTPHLWGHIVRYRHISFTFHSNLNPWSATPAAWREPSDFGTSHPWWASTRLQRPAMTSLIVRFMGPTWGPSGADRTQVGPMLALWTLLSGLALDS